MAPEARARWMEACRWVPAVQDAGWGRRPEPPPPLRDLDWVDYFGCVVIAVIVCVTAVHFRGFLLDDEYSVVNVLLLILTRMHMLVMKLSPAPSSRTALALLPTCPALALSTPPVCYGSSGFADSNWRSDEQDSDYKAARKCFDSLVRDAARTCDEQEDDYKATMKCFDSLVRDAARICFVWSYDAIPLTRQCNIYFSFSSTIILESILDSN
ncbi:unnamed protein product [Miscanthus lutarioriparius]|uniref:Uncharacterized protein n=1 Tax=Miscanthus lutarioriparius TaxID=422564 RepID=A0A811RHP5_9POAL|nr:unnamed protein product [Miscanthus lutarioriparius]